MIACKDCRHLDDSWGHYCARLELAIDDVIYGKLPADPRKARSAGGGCGPEARLFEDKPTKVGWFRSLFT